MGTPNKTIVSKAASVLAAAGKIAKKPSFSAYDRLFELAEDCKRDLAVALARRPQNQTEIAKCRGRLVRVLKVLLSYEKPRLRTMKVRCNGRGFLGALLLGEALAAVGRKDPSSLRANAASSATRVSEVDRR